MMMKIILEKYAFEDFVCVDDEFYIQTTQNNNNNMMMNRAIEKIYLCVRVRISLALSHLYHTYCVCGVYSFVLCIM